MEIYLRLCLTPKANSCLSMYNARYVMGIRGWEWVSGRGLAASPPDFTNPSIMNSKSDQAIAQAIRNGKGKVMPAYPRLTGSQVNSLVQYIRGLSRDPA